MAPAAPGARPAGSATSMEKYFFSLVVPTQVLALNLIGPSEPHMPSLSPGKYWQMKEPRPREVDSLTMVTQLRNGEPRV